MPLSLASAVSHYYTLRSPDLPSNGSSLRDLNCTHSNYQTCKGPVLLFFVTTSLCQDWVICAPAAFLGCGSNLSVSHWDTLHTRSVPTDYILSYKQNAYSRHHLVCELVALV